MYHESRAEELHVGEGRLEEEFSEEVDLVV